MSIPIQQSAIKEVRDQLFLDFADGERLNVVSANLGLSRPAFGFSDDTWRAVSKVLGLNYKQVTTQFAQILSIIFGPQKTVASALKTAAVAGDYKLEVWSTDQMPQIGTIVLDEGLANEEIITYSLIDRYNNLIVLDNVLTYGHAAYSGDVSSTSLLLKSSSSTVLTLGDTSDFPTSYPYPLLLSSGEDNEEVVTISNNSTARRTLTTSALSNSHARIKQKPISNKLSADYVLNTYHITLDSTSKFPDSGILSLTTPPSFTAVGATTTSFTTYPGTFKPYQNINKYIVFSGNITPALANVARLITSNSDFELGFAALGVSPAPDDTALLIDGVLATSGTTSSVTSAASTFISDSEVGNEVAFVGNVTAALAGVTVDIIANTSTTLTFANTITSPVAGDLYYIRPRSVFTRNSYEDNTLVLKTNIAAKAPAGTTVELLSGELAQLAQVQVKGSAWDIIQTDPRHIEILIPDDLQAENTPRSASFIHDEYITGAVGSSFPSGTTAGDTRAEVSSTLALAPFGIIDIDSGAEIIGYSKEIVNDIFLATGSSNGSSGAVLKLLNGGLTVNSLITTTIYFNEFSATVASNTADAITLTTTLPDHVYAAFVDNVTIIKYYDPNWISFGQPIAISHAAFTLFLVTETTYSGSTIVNGNYASIPDTFAGPYIYDVGNVTPTNIRNLTTASKMLAGPMQLVMQQIATKTALEVEDASFAATSGYPYSAIVGSAGGSRETVEVTDIGKRQLTYTDLDQPASPGDLYIEVTSLGTLSGARFPNANGYRVIIDERTVDAEVIYVTGVDGTAVPPRILCEPLTGSHLAGATVSLLADVIAVSPLSKNHSGYITLADRTTIFPAISSVQRTQAEKVQIVYSELDLTSITGVSDSGYLLLNFGNSTLSAKSPVDVVITAGLSVFTVEDSSSFPISGYPYVIKLGEGSYNEEIVTVTNNDGVNTFTISSTTRYQHEIGDIVSFTAGVEESVEYTSLDSNTLSFPAPIMLKSNHHALETVCTANLLLAIKTNGYDFPLRLPTDFRSRVEYLFNLLRAAGVKVSIISVR